MYRKSVWHGKKGVLDLSNQYSKPLGSAASVCLAAWLMLCVLAQGASKNFEEVSQNLPAGWSQRHVRDLQAHNVGVVDFPGTPKEGGNRVLEIRDSDNTQFPHSPAAVYTFEATSNPISLHFDFMLPDGEADNNPMLFIGNNGNEGIMLHLNNNGRVLNRSGEGVAEIQPGQWYRMQLKLSALTHKSKPAYSVSLLRWNVETEEYEPFAERGNLPGAKPIEAYSYIQFQGYVWGKGQPKHKGVIYIDNVNLDVLEPSKIDTSEQEVEIETSFSSDLRNIKNVKPDRSVSITGELPKGWRDRSGYQDGVQIEYKPVVNSGEQGLSVHKTSPGETQLFHPLPSLPKGRYELDIRGFNPGALDIMVGLRDNGPPYKWPWRTQAVFGDEWRTESYTFELGSSHTGVGFYIIVRGPEDAMIALADLHFRRLMPADILRRLAEEFPQGGPSNLFRNTSFFEELPAGWQFALESPLSWKDAGWQIQTDDNAPGGTGKALQLQSQSATAVLNSAPMRMVQVDKPNTASFYHRGEGQWTVEIISEPGQVIASKTFAANSNWERTTLTFQPDLYAPRVCLRIKGKGQLYVDAFQLEPSAKATEFQRAFPAELAIRLENQIAKGVPVLHGAETPANLSMEAVGLSESDTLRVVLYNAYGDSEDITPKAKPETHCSVSKINCEHLPAQRPLGAFRVEAWVENKSGEIISAIQESVYLRVPKPPFYDSDAPHSYFGAHIEPNPQTIALAKAVGINWTRLHDVAAEFTEWYYLEPEPGQWHFRDEGIQMYRDAKIDILGMLLSTPPWASIHQAAPDDAYYYYGKFFYPEKISDWQQYVERFVERNKDDIRAYDVWNEPWGGGYLNASYDPSKRNRAMFGKIDEPVKAYMQLVESAYTTVKSIAPEADVAVDITKPHWMREQTGEGLDEYSDALAVHTYVSGFHGYPGDGISAALSEQAELARKLGKPLWMTEGSSVYNSHYSGFYHHTLAGTRKETNPNKTAESLMRYQIACMREGVSKFFLYTMRAKHFLTKRTPWALLVMQDGMPHPSAAAQAWLAHRVDGKTFQRHGEVVSGLYYIAFSEGGTTSLVLTPAPGFDRSTDLLRVPELRDLYGNPLLDENMPAYPLYFQSQETVDATVDQLRKAFGDSK